MIKFTIQGRSVNPGDIGKELMVAAAKAAADALRERIESIRHPDTAEFPTVVVRGESLDEMFLLVEGSTELLALVRERLTPDELQAVRFPEAAVRVPHVFLSYASEDRALAEVIATGLQAQGIETWWAEWEIRAGDSLRQKIDQGLANCTHFVVLLTSTSVTKPWVNLEMDAGLVRRIGDQCTFIPLRHGLQVPQLPPLLSGMLSPEIDAAGANLQQLINDIHGLSRKPALGSAPAAAHGPKTGYSPAATAVARVFVMATQHGNFADPQKTTADLATETNLSAEDVTDALHELRGMVQVSFDSVWPKPELFAAFDRFWMDWDPAQDALRLAADLVNDASFPSEPREIAVRYGWAPRRLNPAIAFLGERGALKLLTALMSGPFVAVDIARTDATRRFVRSRS